MEKKNIQEPCDNYKSIIYAQVAEGKEREKEHKKYLRQQWINFSKLMTDTKPQI